MLKYEWAINLQGNHHSNMHYHWQSKLIHVHFEENIYQSY